MRRLLERDVYFTLTVTTSAKQIRCVVCSGSKIENRVCEQETNEICANAKHRDVELEIEQDATRKPLLTKQARN